MRVYIWKRGIFIKKILTSREREVFELLILNKSTKDIANILKISEKTVRNHISNTMQKLGVKGRAQAVVELIRLGNITLWVTLVTFFFCNIFYIFFLHFTCNL